MAKIINSQLKELEIPDTLYEKFLKIKAFAFDIDGVMTDGGILVASNGDFLRSYDAKDGFGLRMAYMHGFKLGIITGGHSESIVKRFSLFGFDIADIYLSSKNKIADFESFMDKHGLQADEIAYCGDDLPDCPVMAKAGIGICPADAMEEALKCADYVSVFPGGKRFVRDIIEIVLRIQGKWNLDISAYEKCY